MYIFHQLKEENFKNEVSIAFRQSREEKEERKSVLYTMNRAETWLITSITEISKFVMP